MTDDDNGGKKWYNAPSAKDIFQGISIAIVAVGIGVGVGYCSMLTSSGRAEETRAKGEVETRLEYQRMRTVEEIVRAQGTKMSPKQLEAFLERQGLSKD